MLCGLTVDSNFVSVQTVMCGMNESPYKFQITGSRLFGGATANSDWDFFAEYSDEIMRYLLQSGFVDITKHSTYKDISLVRIFYKKCSDGEIHVQLVKNFDQKLRAQEVEIKRILWNVALVASER